MAPWQREFVEAVFGNVDRSGRRQTRIAYLQIARKQGKSGLAAAVALYMLAFDNEANPQVYLAAFDREQAGIVYRVAADMAERSPVLREYVKPFRGTKRIVCTKGPSKGGFLQAIACDAAGSHGFNASCVVVDELHTQKTPDLIDVLETSMSAREQPLMFAISTAGHDRESICYRWYSKARQVQSGHIKDKAFVGRLYELPEGTSFEDIAETDRGGHFVREKDLWPLANPSLIGQPGGFIRPDEIRRQVRDAMHFPAAQSKVLQLHFNVWTQSSERWFSRAAWDACAGGVGGTFEDYRGRQAFGGLDLSSTGDFTALAWVLPDEDGYDVLCRFWLPEAAVEKRSAMRDQLLEWVRAGWLELTPGDAVDYEYIKARLLEDCTVFDVKSVGYDPWMATQIAIQLAGEGVTMVPVRQGFKTLSPPSKFLETLIANRTLRHYGNGVLRWMADNVVAEYDPYEAVKPSKRRSNERIDGVAALVTALAECIATEAEPVYDFVSFES